MVWGVDIDIDLTDMIDMDVFVMCNDLL